MTMMERNVPGSVTRPRDMVLTEIRLEAESVISLAFQVPERLDLSEWAPGAHIEITLPSGKIRQYSLCGDPHDRKTYRVAVLRVPDGRGGSAEVHDALRVGARYSIRGPRNHFQLLPAATYFFIAGGIGVTPILPMIGAMQDGRDWRALYCGRTRESMAFVNALEGQEHVRIVSDDRDGRPDLGAEIAACAPGTHIYCCGPSGLIDAVTSATAGRDDIALFTERFGPVAPVADPETGKQAVELRLARSQLTVMMQPGESVLQAVLRVKPDMPYSCESGFCGTCETAIIEGDVEHRDQLHSEAERDANRTMMICVSRPSSSRLVLDL